MDLNYRQRARSRMKCGEGPILPIFGRARIHLQYEDRIRDAQNTKERESVAVLYKGRNRI